MKANPKTTCKPYFSPLLLLALILIPLLAFPNTIWGQDSSTGPGPEGVTADQVNEVAKELWCPLCSGVRLDSCELKACDQMKEEIAIKLADGQSAEEIQDYFFAQYGPQVLGEPPREGFNWLAWILPVVALVAGAAWLWTKTRRLVGPTVQTLPADTSDTPSATPADEYERKLEEELKRYG